jgi:hypothetical protein
MPKGDRIFFCHWQGKHNESGKFKKKKKKKNLVFLTRNTDFTAGGVLGKTSLLYELLVKKLVFGPVAWRTVAVSGLRHYEY